VKRHPLSDRLREITEKMVESYGGEIQAQNIDPDLRLPSRHATTRILDRLFDVFFPGFHGIQHLTEENVRYHIGAVLDDVADELADQLYLAFHFECPQRETRCEECTEKAGKTVEAFFECLPRLRRTLTLDVQAAYDGDPAAPNLAEIVFAYPGLVAITIYRIAHELQVLGVPLLPRIMTEHAHSVTGIDIHPGARIGDSFFIDHGTGVVIGETTDIGNGVKIYQGVTLGALSFPKDERGKLIRGTKRHPTIRDNVVIYAGATILGGDTVIGEGAVVGGNTWVIASVPPHNRVLNETHSTRIENNHVKQT
jgi:serine O-acetyltransferase